MAPQPVNYKRNLFGKQKYPHELELHRFHGGIVQKRRGHIMFDDDDEESYYDDENNYVYNNYVCEDCGYRWLADDYAINCPVCGSENIQQDEFL